MVKQDLLSAVLIGISFASVPLFAHASCGDGTLELDEECDDANVIENDGCASDCTLEAFFCSEEQGKPILNPSVNACDGSLGCRYGQKCEVADCTPTHCTCEPGQGWFCSLDCAGHCVGCGDWSVSESEECDDGNNENGDGCSAECLIEEMQTVSLPIGLPILLLLLFWGIGSHFLRERLL